MTNNLLTLGKNMLKNILIKCAKCRNSKNLGGNFNARKCGSEKVWLRDPPVTQIENCSKSLIG